MRMRVTDRALFERCARALTIDGACHGLVDDLNEAGFDLPSVYLLVDERLRCHAARGYFRVVDGFPPGHGVIGQVVATGRAQLIQDIRSHPEFIAAIPGVAAEGCFPVFCGGRVVGVVNIEAYSALPADTDEVGAAAATQLGQRIQDLGGLRQPSLWHRLARMAVELTEASTVSDIERRTLRAATEIAGMSSAALAHKTPRGGLAVATHGGLVVVLDRWDRHDWELMTSWISAGTSSHFPEAALVPAEYEFLRRSGIGAMSVLPLVVGGSSDGVLLVADTQPVEHATFVVEALEVLAAQSAASLGLALARDEAARRADYDLLTGLGNRARFRSEVASALGRDGAEVAVLLLDLDDFKNVNDSLGHQAGDALLVKSAARIVQLLRAGDTVCRLGGDEFVVVLPGTSRDEAADVADRLLDALAQHITVDGMSMRTTVSIGIAMRSDQEETPEELLKAADFAMYLAKEAGKSRYAFFEAAKRLRVRQRLALESDLRTALSEQRLDIVYQPIVELASGRMAAVEALVRWTTRERGPVPVEEFIQLAEEKGLIRPLGRWVLQQACEQLTAWDADGGDPLLRLAVNVSSRQLEQPGLIDDLDGCLGRGRGLNASRLTVEITESALSRDDAMAKTTLDILRDRGVEIAVDDFGTGYSSLALLSSAPVTQLKIDRTFVQEIDRGASVPIVDATLMMANGLGLDVVAEGVETLAQLAYLRTGPCQYAQGFALAEPMPAAEIGALQRGPRPWDCLFAAAAEVQSPPASAGLGSPAAGAV
ncbi:MAG: EAL domain-containing protein [Nocardioidaceae bacterium]|nr:EAL domain-containing protein [Nocardioidaceae bacterium]